MKKPVVLLLALATLGLGTAACTTEPGANPMAPTALATEAVEGASGTTGASDVRGDEAIVTLKGVVRRVDPRRHLFTLMVSSGDVRPVPQTIRIDERTEIWAGGHRQRRRSVEIGMNCEVQGLDKGEYVLARKITLLRRDAR